MILDALLSHFFCNGLSTAVLNPVTLRVLFCPWKLDESIGHLSGVPVYHMNHYMTKPTNWPVQSALCDQSLRCRYEEVLGAWLPIKDKRILISLGIRLVWSGFFRWVHRSFCWFCHVAAPISIIFTEILFCASSVNPDQTPHSVDSDLKASKKVKVPFWQC